MNNRGVAQPGRASALGAECRQFESGYPDTKKGPLWGPLFVSKVRQIELRSQFDKISLCTNRESAKGEFCATPIGVARRVRTARQSRIAVRTNLATPIKGILRLRFTALRMTVLRE